jgi:hypothetical protein
MLIPGYKIPDLSPIDVNLFFEKLNLYPGTRRVEEVPGAFKGLVGKVVHLCQLSSFPSSIAIFVDAIGQNTSIRHFVPPPSRDWTL